MAPAGGFTGEIAIGTATGGHRWAFRVSNDENCITNHLHNFETTSGAVHVLASNNDVRLRQLDPEARQVVRETELPWASNCAVVNPRDRCGPRLLLAARGRHPSALLRTYCCGGRLTHAL